MRLPSKDRLWGTWFPCGVAVVCLVWGVTAVANGAGLQGWFWFPLALIYFTASAQSRSLANIRSGGYRQGRTEALLEAQARFLVEMDAAKDRRPDGAAVAADVMEAARAALRPPQPEWEQLVRDWMSP